MAKSPPTQLDATAHHEAGHAYAAVVLGIGFRRVTIQPGEDYLGVLVRKRWRNFQPDIEMTKRVRWLIDDYLQMVYAGPIAEELRTKKWNAVGASGDMRNAVDMGSYVHFPPKVLGAYLRYIDIQVRHWLQSRDAKTCVRAIAKSLLARTTLTSKQVHEVVYQAREADLQRVLAQRAKRK